MTLAFGFVLSSYIIYILGVIALGASEALGLPVVIFSLLLLSILFAAELKEKIPVITGKNFRGYYVGPLALVLIFFAFNLPILDTFCYLLLILLFTRIVYKKEINDYLFCYIISLACLLIGAMGTAEISFAFIFVIFFIVISWCMILFHLRIEHEDELKINKSSVKYAVYDDQAFQKGKIGSSFFGLTSLLVLSSLIVTLMIFFLMPRLGKGYMRLYAKSRQPVSGFSNQVELGDIGRIKLDHSVVMRIDTYRKGKKVEPEDDIYWRGIALDRYDGKRWYNSFADKRKAIKIGKQTYKIDIPKGDFEYTKHIIYLEPLDTEVIFVSGRPLSINAPFKWINIDYNNSLFRSEYPYGRIRLVLNSDLSKKGRYLLSPDKDNLSAEKRKKYLQLPSLSKRFLDLTKNIAGDIEKKSQRAIAIESYLKTTFGYTLDQSTSKNISPVDYFLFEKKEGHCEYFASAMVMMLRALNIPSRLVNGFLKGEWNPMGEYLLVRQSHAHSWVEAMLDDQGWVIFDPTPADPSAFVSGSFFVSMERYLDALKMNWYRYFINFSWQDQQAIARNIHKQGLMIKEKFDMSFSEIYQYFKVRIENSGPVKIAIMAVMFVCFLVFCKKIISLIRFSTKKKMFYKDRTVEIYLKMLALLEKKGFAKENNITPREFSCQIKNNAGTAWENVQIITDAYYESRFGGRELVKEKELRQSLKDLSKQI